ncbi:MAG: hypothetical protein KDA60_01145 [Planctomycetales bacterium]|nr:hypothetical protein [Planctomycetales bacterium]
MQPFPTRSAFGAVFVFFVGSLALPCVSTHARADAVGQPYELTVAVVKTAERGWQQYRANQFAGQFNGGNYTDPSPATRGKDFWSNGQYALVDREGTGHFETCFAIVDGELVYVGCIGPQGRFTDVAHAYQMYVGKPWKSFLISLSQGDRAN